MMKLSNNNEGFIILSVNCTWLFHNPVHVYGAITQKGDSVVEVFSTPTFDEARLLVNQKYPQNHYAIPLFNGFQPVSIPVAGEFAVERPDKIECDSNLWSDMRIWREKSPCFETSVKEFADASTGFWGLLWKLSLKMWFPDWLHPNSCILMQNILPIFMQPTHGCVGIMLIGFTADMMREQRK